MTAKGLKRACSDCGARFYDMNKRPIICPACGAEFNLDSKTKSKKVRAAVAAVKVVEKPANDTEAEEIEAAEDTVSLDEMAELDESDIDPISTSDEKEDT